MIKKILIFFLMFLLTVSSVSVLAEDFPILERQVEIRKAHLEWITAIFETSMDGVIRYVDEIDGDSSELSKLLIDFEVQTGKIGTLTTHIALNNAIRQLIQITSDFGIETRRQMSDNNGKYLELLNSIKSELEKEENKVVLDDLNDRYWRTRKTNALVIFDIHVERAQKILNKLNDSYDIDEAQKKLEEIVDIRSELEAALDERDNSKILQVYLEILALSKELGKIVIDLQVKIPIERILEYWISVGDPILKRIDTIISELDTLEIDVTELREIHSKAENDLEKAKDAFDDEPRNLEGAIDALRDLKTDFIELRKAYEELVFGGVISGNMKIKVESTSDDLGDTVEDMEESLTFPA